jgi:hypothetical protein
VGADPLALEKRTVSAMIRMYCAARHTPDEPPCADCAGLEGYAHGRLDRCRFGAAKPACARCPTPCYRPAERERMRTVMRWAGPRMVLRHPVLALRHLRRTLALLSPGTGARTDTRTGGR